MVPGGYVIIKGEDACGDANCLYFAAWNDGYTNWYVQWKCTKLEIHADTHNGISKIGETSRLVSMSKYWFWYCMVVLWDITIGESR